ncbi:outer membrane beta-barrel protein [Sphingomonas sp. 28-63-12]|uniref:outer membrane beta-barrel protein n=1 Tax=Sphingomonas sp. 28-63-12 TaxID=1970434 RepID=UPI000BD4012F|nr:MAG: hypothetical protein B7Y47_11245 [Sphingomonas sp. 28-63-12]
MMKTLLFAGTALLMVVPTLAHAQDDANTFTGAHIGVDISRTRNSLRNDPGVIGTTDRNARNGVGYRAHAGYDVQLGNVVIGAEAGIGGGGKSVRQTGTRGQYVLDPGLTYDVSARAGLVAVDGLLLYGRGGYRWLQSDRRTAPAAANGATATTRQTERAFSYGAGAEVLVSRSLSLRAEYNRTPYDKGYKANAFSIGGSLRF